MNHSEDLRIVITDQENIITATEFWNPKLVLLGQVADQENQKHSLKKYLRQYSAEIVWTYDEKSISAAIIPSEQDLTFFMLANTELYHFKEKFWQYHARNYWTEVEEDIESAKKNLQEAESRKRMLDEQGPIVYKKHTNNLYGVQSATLKRLLKKIHHFPAPKTQKKSKP